LCRLLAIDSRTSAVDLAQKLGVSVETVVQAIKRLRKQHIILGHSIVMGLDKLGVSHYKILLTLNNVTEKDIRALEQFARQRFRVLGIFRSLADYDYQVDVEVESVQQLKEITMELNERFSHIIHDYEVLRIAHMPRYTFFP
jgi:DNA-binding Lrp family transcriptional regulator